MTNLGDKLRTHEISIVWDLIPVILAATLAYLLWRLDITQAAPAIAAGFLLELVIVCHRILHRVKQIYPLLGQISSVPELPKAVEKISHIVTQPGPLKQTALQMIVTEFGALVSSLQKGKVSLPPAEFMKIAGVLYSRLGRSDTLIATSLSAGGDYWTQNFGPNYADLNKRAHSCGASIDRIYILRDEAHFQEKKAILTFQSSFSNVYVLLTDKKPLEPNEERDAFVINEDIAAEFIFNDRYVIKHVDLITDVHEIRELRRLLHKVRGLAERLTLADNA